MHAGTVQDRGDTRIGNGNLFLAYTHVAHDCVVGNLTTFSNNAQIAGHVHIDDWAVLGAFAGVHQFVRVGAHTMLAAFAVVLQDVPPYVTVQGYPAKPHGTNNEGLRRRGFAADDILQIRRAYKTLYRENLTLDDARAKIEADAAESAGAGAAGPVPRGAGPRHRPLAAKGPTGCRMPPPARRRCASASSPAKPPATRWPRR